MTTLKLTVTLTKDGVVVFTDPHTEIGTSTSTLLESFNTYCGELKNRLQDVLKKL